MRLNRIIHPLAINTKHQKNCVKRRQINTTQLHYACCLVAALIVWPPLSVFLCLPLCLSYKCEPAGFALTVYSHLLTSALVTITRVTVLLLDLSRAFSNTSAKYRGGFCAQRTENTTNKKIETLFTLLVAYVIMGLGILQLCRGRSNANHLPK